MDVIITSSLSDDEEPSNPLLDKIKLIQGNVIEQPVDAIITALPQSMEYSDPMNAEIWAAAGSQFDEFVLDHIYQPAAGESYAVPGFDMPCKHILISIMPRYTKDFDREDRYLLTAIRNAMELARSMTLESIAIGPIFCGTGFYPLPRGARLIARAISDRLYEGLDEIRIVCDDVETARNFAKPLHALGWHKK